MDFVLKHFLIAATAATLIAGEIGPRPQAPKFYDDDPIAAIPDLATVESARRRGIDPLFDFLRQSARPDLRPGQPAEAVNTLGEVPDSSWYTNRHARLRMTMAELQRGPGNANAPAAPFEVIGAKTEGITPGFTIRDAKGRVYFVKPDPASNPEMATAADVIGSKFFHALGYNTPENYILRFRRSQLTLAKEAKLRQPGRNRRMTEADLDAILDPMPRDREGALRVVASLRIEGKPLGPFKYEGTRADDPNDIVAHENRRDLRGLHVFAAWLNHTDVKAGNTLDVLVNGAIRHYLIDFGATLGSDSDMPKDARYGREYALPKGGEALKRMFTFGLAPEKWEGIEYPESKAVGRFESARFDPELWKSNYPNPAFLSRLPDDEYWAAKQVMTFTDAEIRAIVETGEYSDSRDTDTVARILAERRDAIGRTYFEKVLPLERFRVEQGALRFDDLRVVHGFGAPREYAYQWMRFDNDAQESDLLGAETSARLPAEAATAGDRSYFVVLIHEAGDRGKTVRVYVRKRGGEYEVVGIERRWVRNG